ncbi:MAG TPA: hypothetical protein VFQ50_10440, partial [Flavobacterium sp.]|nr:hypothetical protein [Flavobacterium sp.]
MRHKFGLFMIVVCVLLTSVPSFANPLFTLTVVKTDETCPGNGSLTFTAAGTIPGSTITYSIYHLPDVTNAISFQSTNTLTGLVAGTYRVIATETSGSTVTTQQQDVQILSLITPLSFQLTTTKEICGNDGTVSVSVSSGNAVSYEIFSGPATYPLQPSNIFTQLTAGTYQLRVFDNCGQGVVQNFTVISASAGMTIGSVTFPNAELEGCDLILVNNIATAPTGMVVAYPLTVQYTVHPPTGPAIVINQTVPNGGENGITLSAIIPFYHNQSYTYDVQVIDGCGNIFNNNGNLINKHLTVVISAPQRDCTRALLVTPSNFVGPFTV